jgi:hypothetical protein
MFNPGDYTIEKLRYAKDFNIYPPVDANFKFETLGDDDDPYTSENTIVQEKMPRPSYYTNKRPLRGGINGSPNPRKPKSSRFEPSNRPYPRNESPYDRQGWNTLFKTLKNGSFKKK